MSQSLERSHNSLRWSWAYLVSLFSPKDFAPFFLVILGCFLRWVNLCMGPLRSGFSHLCPIAFVRVFPVVVNSQGRQILWHSSQLCSVWSMLIVVKHSCSGPIIFQGRLHTWGLLLASWLWSSMACKGDFFLSRSNFCLFWLSQDSLLLWEFFSTSFQFALRGNFYKNSCNLVEFVRGGNFRVCLCCRLFKIPNSWF